MAVYPESIAAALENLAHVGDMPTAKAKGRAVNFDCGGFVEISVGVDEANDTVREVRFRTSGCGYLAAAAEFLCSELSGKPLADLHGLDDLEIALEVRFNAPPRERSDCFAAALGACKAAFWEYRLLRIDEFAGGEALICTCFGVSEETVQRFIGQVEAPSVAAVSASLRAGSGCGSCRMLIQELIDSAAP